MDATRKIGKPSLLGSKTETREPTVETETPAAVSVKEPPPSNAPHLTDELVPPAADKAAAEPFVPLQQASHEAIFSAAPAELTPETQEALVNDLFKRALQTVYSKLDRADYTLHLMPRGQLIDINTFNTLVDRIEVPLVITTFKGGKRPGNRFAGTETPLGPELGPMMVHEIGHPVIIKTLERLVPLYGQSVTRVRHLMESTVNSGIDQSAVAQWQQSVGPAVLQLSAPYQELIADTGAALFYREPDAVAKAYETVFENELASWRRFSSADQNAEESLRLDYPSADAGFAVHACMLASRKIIAEKYLSKAISQGKEAEFIKALTEATAIEMNKQIKGDRLEPILPEGKIDNASVRKLNEQFVATLADVLKRTPGSW